jgi:hypothetical protein
VSPLKLKANAEDGDDEFDSFIDDDDLSEPPVKKYMLLLPELILQYSFIYFLS